MGSARSWEAGQILHTARTCFPLLGLVTDILPTCLQDAGRCQLFTNQPGSNSCWAAKSKPCARELNRWHPKHKSKKQVNPPSCMTWYRLNVRAKKLTGQSVGFMDLKGLLSPTTPEDLTKEICKMAPCFFFGINFSDLTVTIAWMKLCILLPRKDLGLKGTTVS